MSDTPDATVSVRDSTASEDAELAKVLEACLVGLEAGLHIDPDRLVAEHSAIADRLRGCLVTLRLVEQTSDRLADGPASDQPGSDTRTLGDYRIIREVGRGGMGVVYEAEQISLGRRVALKVLPFAAVLDRRQLRRFENEAHAAAQLHHANILPVHGIGCERGVHFYAMQLVEGPTLADVVRELQGSRDRGIEKRRDGGTEGADAMQSAIDTAGSSAFAGRLTGAVPVISGDGSTRSPAFFRSVATLGIQAAEALEHAHDMGVIHRDVKPSNLLLDARGHLWVTDFGLAHCQGDNGHTLTMPGDLLGTLRYMSPEQAQGGRALIDHRTDVYSLGVTLYELLTLQPALTGRDRQELLRTIADEEPRRPRQLNDAIPADLETIVLKATEKQPQGRYATAQALADDLRRFLNQKPILAKRPSLFDRATKWARRHRAVVTAGIVVLLMAVAALAVTTVLTQAAYESEAQQRARAEASFEQARTAVEEMTRIAEEELVDIPHMSRIRKALLEEALHFYQAFLQQKSNDPVVKHETALAHLRAGRIQAMLGKNAGSKEAYEQATALLEPLVAAFPATPDYRQSLADSYARSGRPGDAIDLLEKLVSAFPTVPEYRQDLANTYRAKGKRLGDFEPDEAEGAYRRSVTLLQQLVADFPNAADFVRDLANSEMALAWHLYFEQHRREGVEEIYRRALQLRRQLAVEFPSVRAYRQDLAAAQAAFARFLRRCQKKQEAYAEYEKTLAIEEQLQADFPNVPDHAAAVAFTRTRMGALLDVQGHHEKAERLLRPAVEQAEELVAAFPDDTWYRVVLEGGYFELGKLCGRTGRDEEAVKYLRAAISVHELAHAHSVLGYQLISMGRHDEALAHFRRGLVLHQQLVKDHPNVVRYIRQLVSYMAAHPELDELPQALELAMELVERAPECGDCWDALGEVHRQGENWQASIAPFEKALGLLVAGRPDTCLDLAVAYAHLGQTDQARRRYDEAVEWIEKKGTDREKLRRKRAEAATLLGIDEASTTNDAAREE